MFQLRTLTPLALLSLSLLLTSCSSCGSSENNTNAECATGADCESGICDRFAGECLDESDSSPQKPGDRCGEVACPQGLECVGRPQGSICMSACQNPGEACESGDLCVTTSQGPSVCYIGRTVGENCQGSEQCASGQSCINSPEDGPICVLNCDTSGTLCTDGTYCMETGSQSICSPGGDKAEGEECESTLECVAGRRCVNAAEKNLCLRACESAAECRDGAVCTQLVGAPGSVCRPGQGASCAMDADCVDGLSCTQAFSDVASWVNLFPGGYCTKRDCSATDCAAGSVCAKPGARSPVCMATCESDVDCRLGQGWECLGADACEGQGCRDFFGESRFCMRPDRLGELEP